MSATVTRSRPSGSLVGFDGLTEPWDFDSRKHRCYELAGHAIVTSGAPAGSLLVHGSWHGPGAPRRISHAIVILPDGRVWEPIKSIAYDDFEQFQHWTDWRTERVYTRKGAGWKMVETEHYGPWHETTHP